MIDDKLLLRFLNKQCSGEDICIIDAFIQESKENADMLFEMERIWSLRDEFYYAQKYQLDEAYQQLQSRLEEFQLYTEKSQLIPPPKKYLSWLKYAAVAIIAGLLAFNLYEMKKTQHVVADNILEVPNGERVSLTLSDGTKVWINAGSKFSYPSSFSRENRTVTLEGEGFFEVTPNKKCPFIVKGQTLEVKVLGTRFNFKSYGNEMALVALQEGKLEVMTNDKRNRLSVNPNEMVSYSEKGGLSLQSNLDLSQVDHWIMGEFLFSNERLIDIVFLLNRSFNTTIEIADPELNNERFSCRTHANISIYEVLDLLKETKNIDYIIKDNSIKIIKTNKNNSL